MAYDNFAIDSTAIKNPSEYDVNYYTITESNRTADGTMVMEYIANKRTFKFTYDFINSDELDTILDILWTQLPTTKQCFHTLEYMDNNEVKTATVYAGAIPKKLHRGHGAKWVWKNVTFSLIEQ